MAQPALSASLPKEQDNHLKASLRYLDERKYDSVDKELNQVFRKFPDHADALAVKALAVQQQQIEAEGRKRAAKKFQNSSATSDIPTENPFDIAKKALAADFRSVIAWHVMGTLHRNDKNYPEAMKAYRQAWRVEEKLGPWADGTPRANANLLRDITIVAIQAREWDALVEVRQRALNLRSAVRVNWLMYCVAHYMAGHLELASAIADTVCKVMEPGDGGAEINEIMLFRAQLKMELGRAHEAVPILNGAVKGEEPTAITDRSEKNNALAKAFVAAKQKPQARAKIQELLKARDAERDNLFLLAQVEGIKIEPAADPDGGCPREVTPSAEFVALLDAQAELHPRCDAAKRLALDYCDAAADPEAFSKRLTAYILPYVRGFVPSLVTVLESLYVSRAKVAAIERIFLRWQKMLEDGDESEFQQQQQQPPKKEEPAVGNKPTKNPCLLLSVYEFLAAHHRLKGEYEAAHKYIDKAIEHTPTYEMLYLDKARIFNAEGRHRDAAPLADKARLLDLQDKYLNNKAAQYLMRAGDIETAERRMALFFKPSPAPDVFLQSMELQYTWYEKELGAAYLAKGDFPSALRALTLVEKHQSDNHEELGDFHNYALRRNNIRQWLDVIKMEDGFSGTSHFLAACPFIVRCWLGIHGALKAAVGGGGGAADLRDKVKVMTKDEVDAVLYREGAHEPRPKLEGYSADDEQEQKRIEKFADEYWNLKKQDMTDPLQKATRYVDAMCQHRKNSVETHELAFELHFTAGRALLAAQALAHLHRVGREKYLQRRASAVAEFEQKLGDCTKRLQSMAVKNGAVKELVDGAVAKFKTAELVKELKSWAA